MSGRGDMSEAESLAQWVLDRTSSGGASAAEVMLISAESLSAGVRLGEVEKLKSSRERRLGLRVFSGKSSATASTAELGRGQLSRFVEEAIALARVTSEDPWSGLPDPQEHPKSWPELELADPSGGLIDPETALGYAREGEKAALGYDPRIRNSDGAEFASGSYHLLFANSNGFAGEYSGTTYSLMVAPIAEENARMQSGYWYSANRRHDKLEDAAEIGRTAARRALRMLGAKKIKTTRAPVVFDPDRAAGLIGTIAGAASGPALYKGASFLVDRLGTQIASTSVTILDDATMVGALGSKPFDGEGLATRRKALVDRGILATYLLDVYSGRKLGLPSTANAARSVGGPPSVSAANLYLQAGQYSPEQIIGSVKRGFYVTGMIGFGINAVTGDYSRGASGIWIEDGELAFPVEEVTIAGNLKDMYMGIEMVGNDLLWRSSTVAPTIKISEMIIAGN
jgi:PmbA protein